MEKYTIEFRSDTLWSTKAYHAENIDDAIDQALAEESDWGGEFECLVITLPKKD